MPIQVPTRVAQRVLIHCLSELRKPSVSFGARSGGLDIGCQLLRPLQSEFAREVLLSRPVLFHAH